jgi:hypothetical protein
MQQPVEDFLRKTPVQRLRDLAKSWSLTFLALGLVSIPTVFWALAQKKEVESERSYYVYQIKESARTALRQLDTAKDELRKPNSDREVAIEQINKAQQELSFLLFTTRKDKRSTIEPVWELGFIASAYAESPNPEPKAPTLPSEAKRWLLYGVLGVLAIVFIISIVAIFITKDAEVLRFAFDTVKTLRASLSG